MATTSPPAMATSPRAKSATRPAKSATDGVPATRRLARLALAAAAFTTALAASACDFGAYETARSIPGGYVLIQKGDFQALYDGDGHIVRLLQDRNHDGRAEVVIVYYPDGRPQRGEIDTDEDGVVDRWECFRSDGALEKVARSRARDGRPDTWEPQRCARITSRAGPSSSDPPDPTAGTSRRSAGCDRPARDAAAAAWRRRAGPAALRHGA